MLSLTILFFLGLSLLNYRMSKSAFFPGTVFCSMWTISLFALLVCGDTFYPVMNEALLVYVLGAIFFTAGGVFVLALIQSRVGPKVDLPADPQAEGPEIPNRSISWVVWQGFSISCWQNWHFMMASFTA